MAAIATQPRTLINAINALSVESRWLFGFGVGGYVGTCVVVLCLVVVVRVVVVVVGGGGSRFSAVVGSRIADL